MGLAWTTSPAPCRVGVLLRRAAVPCHSEQWSGFVPRLSDALMCGGLLGLCAGAIFSANDFVLIGFIAVLISGVLGPGAGVRAVFGSKPVVWLGEISYSIYLVHFPVLLVLRHGTERVSGMRLMESQAMRLMMF